MLNMMRRCWWDASRDNASFSDEDKSMLAQLWSQLECRMGYRAAVGTRLRTCYRDYLDDAVRILVRELGKDVLRAQLIADRDAL